MMFKIFLLVCLLSQRNACCRKRPKRLVILEMSSSSSPPPRVVLVLVLVIIIVIVISFHANRRARPPRLARLVFLLLPPWPATFLRLPRISSRLPLVFPTRTAYAFTRLPWVTFFFARFPWVMLNRLCHQFYVHPNLRFGLQLLPRLHSVTYFATPITGDIVSHACHDELSFRALANGYNFSSTCHGLHPLPRVTSFPALATGNIFSRACHGLQLSRAFHGYRFSRVCQWLYVFPRLPRVTCFPLCNTFSHVYDW